MIVLGFYQFVEMNVLLIDYHSIFSEEVRKGFSDYDEVIQMQTTRNKSNGIELIRKKIFDLVIIGCKNKNDISDLEVFQNLKATNLAFIVIFSHSNRIMYDTIFNLHPLAIFTLPLDMTALKFHIDKLLVDRSSLISQNGKESNDYFIFKWNSKLRKELYRDICYIHTAGNYISMRLQNKEFLIRHTLKGMEEILPKELFVRTHRNYIVNISHIKSIDVSTNMIQLGIIEIPMGRKYKKVTKESFSNFHDPKSTTT